MSPLEGARRTLDGKAKRMSWCEGARECLDDKARLGRTEKKARAGSKGRNDAMR